MKTKTMYDSFFDGIKQALNQVGKESEPDQVKPNVQDFLTRVAPVIETGKRYLITTDGWFFAPDGQQYRAVYGVVHAVLGDAETLGIKTNARSTNWYVKIGGMLIAGCQLHYAIQTDECDCDGPYYYEGEHNGRAVPTESRSRIYNALKKPCKAE